MEFAEPVRALGNPRQARSRFHPETASCNAKSIASNNNHYAFLG
jgi:hypothetical protein